MRNGIISAFGTYDFFGKAFPGMTLMIGILPLLPSNSIPVTNTFRNIFVFITVLVIIVLFGGLFGEAVHSIAILFERCVSWIGYRVKNTAELIEEAAWGPDSLADIPNRKPSPNRLLPENKSEGPEETEIHEFKNIWMGWKSGIKKWMINRYYDIVYALWGHRDIFERRIKRDPTDPTEQLYPPFQEAYLIAFSEQKFELDKPEDWEKVYPVITSYISQVGRGRAFKLQSRYAFCRSMWVVTLLIGGAYWATVSNPLSWEPKALQYSPYLQELESPQIIFAAYALFFVSLVFLYGAGSYKRHFLDYLFSEFYILQNMSSKLITNYDDGSHQD